MGSWSQFSVLNQLMHFILSSITAHKNSCYYFPSDLLFLSWNRIPEGRIKQQQKNYFSETGWTRSEKDYWQQTFPFIGKKNHFLHLSNLRPTCKSADGRGPQGVDKQLHHFIGCRSFSSGCLTRQPTFLIICFGFETGYIYS